MNEIYTHCNSCHQLIEKNKGHLCRKCEHILLVQLRKIKSEAELRDKLADYQLNPHLYL